MFLHDEVLTNDMLLLMMQYTLVAVPLIVPYTVIALPLMNPYILTAFPLMVSSTYLVHFRWHLYQLSAHAHSHVSA